MAEGRQGWTLMLMCICICVTLGSVIPVGYAFGVINAPAAFIRKWVEGSFQRRYSSSPGESQLTAVMATVVSMFVIGGTLGTPFAPMFNSWLGRRNCLVLSGVIMVVAALLQMGCKLLDSIEMLMVGRLLGGIAAALVYATQPMYLVELAPAELSGSVGVFTCIGITGGIVVGQIFSFDFALGTDSLWPYALAGSGIFVVLGLVTIVFFPESPRFLIAKGRKEQAKSALMRLRGDEARVNMELAQIEAAANSEGPLTMKQVICEKKYLLPLFIVGSFHFVQQMSGINAIWFYSVGIFTDAGFTLQVALWLNFIEGFLNFVVALMGPFLMARFNRRIMMMLSCLGSYIFLTLLVVGLIFMKSFKEASYGCIAFLSLYIIAFNLALGPLPYFIGAEIFESAPRPAGMAFGSFFNWLANVILSMGFPSVNEAIGPYAFLFCAFICICGFFITLCYLPETRNRQPQEVAPLMENGFKSKVKSSP
ncbi:solute carrier family 2, facilitated glucose transporter member 3 isoform X1 [Drosophila bipectinata]|uniref:solute carrier family 2, facilitated glucose transporter member 3 isoform X1 n=1 Tax=Drosophila bipectinata TaxID=42026 RepID=UPI001C895065|nr:solute carrier family 2, facilitated glucose transporter member 3 isoform X1 [Drosophila bipectinata]